MRPGRSWPIAADLVFSGKTFLAAMLALAIALWIDLPRPYWAMATVYITSQPLAGATRSKAVYRVLGTLIGAAGAVVMVPNLVDAPELLCLAVSLWVGGCLYLSLLDRTPRSYVFMLSGYSVALIGLPTVSDPASIFDTALARVEEITLGIVCATFVSTIVFPQSVAPAVTARVSRWLSDARRLGHEVLSGGHSAPSPRGLRLAADAVDIDALASHLAYDRLADANVVRGLHALRLHMLMLLPLLAAIRDRLAALGVGSTGSGSGGNARERPQLARLLNDLAHRFEDEAGPGMPAERLRAAISSLYPKLDAHSSWHDIAMASLLIRLRELVDVSHDCRALMRAIAAGNDVSRLELAFRPEDGVVPARHRDHGMALWSGAGAAFAVLFCSAVWIATGWTDGASAPMMAAVACSFFAAHDDPAPGIRSFGWWSLISIVIVAVYLFAILPAVSNIETLIAALAPPFLLYGFLAARPQTALIGVLLGANTSSLLALQSSYAADFESYADASLAFLIGTVAAIVITKLARSVRADWVARRLMKTSWATLALTAERRGRHDRPAFIGVMLDRLGLLVQRLAAIPEANRRDVENLTQLRVGLNVIDLRHARSGLTAATLEAIDNMLDMLAAVCRRHVSGPMPAELLASIDTALAQTLGEPSGKTKESALIGLVGIRHGLFPTAPAYRPQPPDASPDSWSLVA